MKTSISDSGEKIQLDPVPEPGSGDRIHTMVRRWLPRLALLILLLLVSAQLFYPYRSSPTKTIRLDSLAMTTLDGQPLSPDLIQQKGVIVNFWAPWCGPCRLEAPWLQSIQRHYEGKLLVLGVVADGGEYKRAQQFMNDRHVIYALIRDSPALEEAFGRISVLPTSFYIAPGGKVLYVTRGLVPKPLMLYYARNTVAP